MPETIKNLMYQYAEYLDMLTTEDYHIFTEYNDINFIATKRLVFRKSFLQRKLLLNDLEQCFICMLAKLMVIHNLIRKIDIKQAKPNGEAMYYTKTEMQRFPHFLRKDLRLITHPDEYVLSCTTPIEFR